MTVYDTPVLSTPAPAPAKPFRRAVRRFATPVTLTAILIAFSVVLFVYWQPAIIHPDANGYWAQAMLINNTGKSYLTPTSDAQYLGMHWLMGPNDTFLSRYPTGFPAAIAVVMKYAGWRASLLINPVLAVLTLLGTFLVVRRLTSAGWGVAAVALLAVNGPFIVHALANISHMPVAFCFVWGVWALLHWREKQNPLWLLLVGMLVGGIATTRNADAVMGLGFAVFVFMNFRLTWRFGVGIALGLIGCVGVMLPTLIRNQIILGGFWKSGYSLTNESTGFSWANFTDHATDYLRALQGGGLGMLFGLGLVGIVGLIATRRERATGLMLLLSATPLVLVYMAYYWAMGIAGGFGGGTGGALRFMVPIMPIFVIAAVWALSRMTLTLPTAGRIALPTVLVGAHLLMYGDSTRSELADSRDGKKILALAHDEAEKKIPAGSVLLADNGFLQDLDMLGKWKLADATVVTGRGGMGGGGMRGGPGGGMGGPGGNMGGGRDNFGPPGQRGNGGNGAGRSATDPSPQQDAKAKARAALYPGTTSQKEAKFLKDITAWSNGAGIYVIGTQDDLSRLIPGSEEEDFVIVSRVKTPAAPEEEADDRGGMGGGFGGGNFGGRNNRGRRPGGMFGPSVTPGEDVIIAQYNPVN